jgi:RNA polymerase sigma factor (TIGR02999 family)
MTTTVSPHEITRLLADWSKGDRDALERLTPLVHAELRRIARRQMGRERPGHTLQTTALINEAYLRLAGREGFEWHDRLHFFAVCAQVMRHVLVDHARARARDKRGAGALQVSLGGAGLVAAERSADLLALDEALRALETADPQKGRVVELRYFAGLTVEETAEVLGVAPITVRREERRARAWLHRLMSEGGRDEG